ncbi:MAG: GNAT family N-acetyltransferase [Actinobacteria bacterium]|nr:GNAT family N-acetyltransferase [Actinomycetota bacterium]
MTLRPEVAADGAAVERVVRAAFGEHDPAEGDQVARLVHALHAGGSARGGVVAETGGDVVGHVLLSRGWVDARDRLVEVLVLSPLSVLPRHQGVGIGTALVAEAISIADTSGAPALFLEGSPQYYGARGFEPGSRHGFGRPSPRIPEAAFQVRLLAAHEPTMTGPLVYCEAFWAHDSVGLRDPVLAQLEASLRTDD